MAHSNIRQERLLTFSVAITVVVMLTFNVSITTYVPWLILGGDSSSRYCPAELVEHSSPASERTPDPAAPKVEHPLINRCFIGSVMSLLFMSLIRILMPQATSKKRKEMTSNGMDLLAVSGPAEQGDKFLLESNPIELRLEWLKSVLRVGGLRRKALSLDRSIKPLNAYLYL
ncbi:hypothetical protein CRG98_024326 [Punica granatum]|uniref:Uncharacterized protein n=1 Tax=Punica granatum TaxID=22663 RepID=A0A2I0JHB9_PUNGR|nr:hypothetical protein CRG98_024326 [Punica granatum]